jgi:hypothetical protein
MSIFRQRMPNSGVSAVTGGAHELLAGHRDAGRSRTQAAERGSIFAVRAHLDEELLAPHRRNRLDVGKLHFLLAGGSQDLEYRQTQRRGRDEWDDSYEIRTARVERTYSWAARTDHGRPAGALR